MYSSPPWTEIGALQQEVSTLRSDLHRKAESHEISEINRRLDSFEHSLREISATLDGILSRLQTCENHIVEQSD